LVEQDALVVVGKLRQGASAKQDSPPDLAVPFDGDAAEIPDVIYGL
jgi:hypothetical protein